MELNFVDSFAPSVSHEGEGDRDEGGQQVRVLGQLGDVDRHDGSEEGLEGPSRLLHQAVDVR